MPRIRCHYIDCVFLDDGFCGAAGVEIDPDEGCLTYSRTGDEIESVEEDWEAESELDEIDEWDDLEFEEDEDDDDLWVDDDDDEDF